MMSDPKNPQDMTFPGGHIHTAGLTVNLRSGAGRISCACMTHQGARDTQEDCSGISEIPENGTAERFMAVIADGMGGLPAGAGTSRFAVRELLAADISGNVPEQLCGAFRSISANIKASGSGGGTTLAAVLCLPEGVYFCSAGDSRIYLQRGGVLTQLTEDGDYFGELLDRVSAGTLTYAQAESDPEKASLPQYIGSGAYIQPDCSLIPFQPRAGDRLMLCTDGVYNALTEDELMQSLCLSARGSAEDILGRILARGYGNQDNFTAVALEFQSGGYTAEPPQDTVNSTAELTADIACISRQGGCTENQDCAYSADGVYAVADGLGGHSGGAEASAKAIECLKECPAGIEPEQINSLLQRMNTAVRSLGGGMTTIAAGFADGKSFRWGNVGDSRVYYFRNGEILMQTKDDSVCRSAVESGRLNAEQIRCSSGRNGLLKALGSGDSLRLSGQCEPIRIQSGDAFLICSDGFWEYVHEREMEADLMKSHSSREWLRRMLRRHLLRSHDAGDNYSAVLGIFTGKPQDIGVTKRRFTPWLAAVLASAVLLAAAGVLWFLLK